MISTTFHQVPEPTFFAELNIWLSSVVAELFQNTDTISYVFCTDKYLLEINKTQLNHDYYTDIITFDLRDKLSEPLSCEIYISLDRVKENAAQFNCTFEEELKRVMVHGLLHLSGMNDHTTEEKAAMRKAENNFIKKY